MPPEAFPEPLLPPPPPPVSAFDWRRPAAAPARAPDHDGFAAAPPPPAAASSWAPPPPSPPLPPSPRGSASGAPSHGSAAPRAAPASLAGPPPRGWPPSPLVREGTLSDRIVESFYGFFNHLYPGNLGSLSYKGSDSFFRSGVHECAPELSGGVGAERSAAVAGRTPERRRRTRQDLENEPPGYGPGSPTSRRNIAPPAAAEDLCTPRKRGEEADGGYGGGFCREAVEGALDAAGSPSAAALPASVNPWRSRPLGAGPGSFSAPAFEHRTDDFSHRAGGGGECLSLRDSVAPSGPASSPRQNPLGSDRVQEVTNFSVNGSPDAPASAAPSLTASTRSLHAAQRVDTLYRPRDELAHPQPNDPSRNVGSPRSTPYLVDKDDILDQHVGWYLRRNPEVRKVHSIARKEPGIYELDGREVQVEWQYSSRPGGQGFLVVVDGPLRQPFSDYMEDSERNAQYEGQDIGRSSLHQIPKEQRLSFNDTHKVYSRLEAMKVAKEQALYRERAANYVKDGKDIPNELMHKYKKSLQVKLGMNRQQQQRKMERQPPPPPPPMLLDPSAAITAPAAVAPAAPAAAAPAAVAVALGSAPLGPAPTSPASAAVFAAPGQMLPSQQPQGAAAQHAAAQVAGAQHLQPHQTSRGQPPHLQPCQVSRGSQPQVHPPQLSRGPPPPPPPRTAPQQQPPQQQRVAAMAQAVQAASTQSPLSQRATVGGDCRATSSSHAFQPASGRQSPVRPRATVGASGTHGQASAGQSPMKQRPPPSGAGFAQAQLQQQAQGQQCSGGSHVSSASNGYAMAPPVVCMTGSSLSASTAASSTRPQPCLLTGSALVTAPPKKPRQVQQPGAPLQGIATAQPSTPASPAEGPRQHMPLPPPPPHGVAAGMHTRRGVPPAVPARAANQCNLVNAAGDGRGAARPIGLV